MFVCLFVASIPAQKKKKKPLRIKKGSALIRYSKPECVPQYSCQNASALMLRVRRRFWSVGREGDLRPLSRKLSKATPFLFHPLHTSTHSAFIRTACFLRHTPRWRCVLWWGVGKEEKPRRKLKVPAWGRHSHEHAWTHTPYARGGVVRCV